MYKVSTHAVLPRTYNCAVYVRRILCWQEARVSERRGTLQIAPLLPHANVAANGAGLGVVLCALHPHKARAPSYVAPKPSLLLL